MYCTSLKTTYMVVRELTQELVQVKNLLEIFDNSLLNCITAWFVIIWLYQIKISILKITRI